MLRHGSADFLKQAHLNNWHKYVASLAPDASTGWDLCVLTASDERQASMYRRQLDVRQGAGLLPPHTQFRVIADPDGQRIGSGGATLRVLAMLNAAALEPDLPCCPAPSIDPQPALHRSLLSGGRVLVVHSGGDSRRLPHCSAIGKLFARIPRPLPDGRASTLFDEFLIGFSGLAAELPPGVLVASGDVLLVFDHLQLGLRRPGVVGVAAAAPAEMGTQHGVYVSDRDGALKAYLHKPSMERMRQWGAIDEDGMVSIDTGLVWLDGPTVQAFVGLARQDAVATLCGLSSWTCAVPGDGPRPPGLNLYGDLLMPLAGSTMLDGYLADTSDGPDTPEIRAARRAIWECLHGVPFAVDRLQPAVFMHFGTSREYWALVADSPDLAQLCGWSRCTASWAQELDHRCGDGWALINAFVDTDQTSGARNALIVDSCLAGPLEMRGPALIAGLRSNDPLMVAADMVVHQLPLADGGFVTRVFGLSDDPKLLWDHPAATIMNRPWLAWLGQADIQPETLWPDLPVEARMLWNARLYPLCSDRAESLALSMPLQDPALAPEGWRATWEQSSRLSLAESFAQADGQQILAEITAIEDQVAVRGFYAAVQEEQPAATLAETALLGAQSSIRARRSQLVAARLSQGDPILRLRGYKALAEATGDRRWERRGFETLAAMIEGVTSSLQQAGSRWSTDRHTVLRPGGTAAQSVRVEAAARIDFGGGWTDTPPYSIERGGTVLNAALTLRGVYPIGAEAEWLSEPRIVLHSGDIGASLEPARLGQVLSYADPADPFALLKAALVLCGIVPADEDPDRPLALALRDSGGVRLSTYTTIPRGSGLGTSSIIAGAVLLALARLQGLDVTQEQLFDQVLYLEQMMTTGGGWQDQVGGLVGGIKLITTAPGLPQRIQLEPVRLSSRVQAELAERLLLVYTGQQRLAKNLLRAVMSRWMARDPEMVWILGDIARLAIAMRDALETGDVDRFGSLLGEHWVLNRRMDPGCTNPFIDRLFQDMDPYINGGKLAGAGGGGFAIVIARDGEAVHKLADVLDKAYSGTAVAIWPCAIPASGMSVD